MLQKARSVWFAQQTQPLMRQTLHVFRSLFQEEPLIVQLMDTLIISLRVASVLLTCHMIQEEIVSTVKPLTSGILQKKYVLNALMDSSTMKLLNNARDAQSMLLLKKMVFVLDAQSTLTMTARVKPVSNVQMAKYSIQLTILVEFLKATYLNALLEPHIMHSLRNVSVH